MTKTSTRDLIILQAYNETSPLQKLLLENIIPENKEAQAELEDVQSIISTLNCKLKSPSSFSIQSILDYSESTAKLQEV